ncbi:polyprenyl synthetase family protein [Polynucleobacter sp. MWH-UH24A]|jgi:octaprenyl-diphosphate synthase|uniref:polyprenyl synthetase family protein n=1 Tax=Polynucleobacter sp. MWH-UH24A TaxID=2689110 RepID=UPI001BFCDACB|nr:polyprenyl synthetase family protein [Polynucleobacter sp. MWH-UH24A]QWD76287.1 polyprenyl synthetase family protein [Polynucleobacter sp. MWH-UH24A]
MNNTVKNNHLGQILAPISPDLKALDEVIRRRLASEVVLIDQISSYIIQSGGKRVRPALLLLMAKALANGKETPHALELAAVVEFIHTATLLHDDVVDESTMRRGKQTANAAFGNAASVLVGDFLYSRAFQMMVAPNDIRVMQILSDATNTIAEGEVLQLLNMNDPEVDESSYLQVIRYKTAKLFEASAELGALISQASDIQRELAAAFGRHIGTAFQLMDDLLDYTADPNEMGKNVGDDLREGKPTLPLIFLMEKGSADQQLLAREAISQNEELPDDVFDQILQGIHSSGALEYTQDAARREVHLALNTIKDFPQNPASDSLRALCEYSLIRQG